MKFVHNIIEIFKNIDSKVANIMKYGLIFSFLLCIASTICLFTYEMFYPVPMLFTMSFYVFKSSLMFAAAFVIGAVGFDKIKNPL